MVYHLILSKLSDRDLIYYYYSPFFKFTLHTKKALEAFAFSQPYSISTIPNYKFKDKLKNVDIKLEFDDVRDKAVIRILSQIDERARSNFIKNILRYALETPKMDLYYIITRPKKNKPSYPVNLPNSKLKSRLHS